jgi:aerobic-type carbon monoxide dehydrogenase small subunit (CoxS/CutS family)
MVTESESKNTVAASKRDAMFPKIVRCFFRIPFKLGHAGSGFNHHFRKLAKAELYSSPPIKLANFVSQCRRLLMARVTSLNVNGKKMALDVDSTVSLLSVLRNDLDLTGSKYGCGEGQCGACTVLIDGQATRSCITQVGRAAGKQITTIEGLEKDGKLHPLQEAFIKADAMQCAYCTSGMIMAASALLAKNPKPKREDIVTGMNGNICRCGTYQRIVEAIQMASGQAPSSKEVAK